MINSHRGANRITVRLLTDQTKADTPVSGELIVAIKIRRAVVGSDENVEIAIAIEVTVGQSASDLGLTERFADFGSYIAEGPFSLANQIVQEKLRRLRIPDVAADAAHGVVDVPVSCDQI